MKTHYDDIMNKMYKQSIIDMTVVLGLQKFSLQATIDHHEPSVYSGHYIASINCCKKKPILLQRQQNYGV